MITLELELSRALSLNLYPSPFSLVPLPLPRVGQEKSAPKAVRVPRDHPLEKPKRARWPVTAWKRLKINTECTAAKLARYAERAAQPVLQAGCDTGSYRSPFGFLAFLSFVDFRIAS